MLEVCKVHTVDGAFGLVVELVEFSDQFYQHFCLEARGGSDLVQVIGIEYGKFGEVGYRIEGGFYGLLDKLFYRFGYFFR